MHPFQCLKDVTGIVSVLRLHQWEAEWLSGDKTLPLKSGVFLIQYYLKER